MPNEARCRLPKRVHDVQAADAQVLQRPAVCTQRPDMPTCQAPAPAPPSPPGLLGCSWELLGVATVCCHGSSDACSQHQMQCVTRMGVTAGP